MTRLVGQLERRDLEGGTWVLRAPDGERTLYGDIPADLAGQRVEVEGDAEEGFGIGMVGATLVVRRIRRA